MKRMIGSIFHYRWFKGVIQLVRPMAAFPSFRFNSQPPWRPSPFVHHRSCCSTHVWLGGCQRCSRYGSYPGRWSVHLICHHRLSTCVQSISVTSPPASNLPPTRPRLGAIYLRDAFTCTEDVIFYVGFYTVLKYRVGFYRVYFLVPFYSVANQIEPSQLTLTPGLLWSSEPLIRTSLLGHLEIPKQPLLPLAVPGGPHPSMTTQQQAEKLKILVWVDTKAS